MNVAVSSEGLLTTAQQRLLDAMPELENSVFPAVTDTIPAANYIDPARFDREVDAVFKSVPVILGPSALLPQRGYAQVEIVGMPVLITRAKDGKARAFANVCRHRGAKLCNGHEAVKASKLSCPYHAWTYDLEGNLIGLPKPEIFPGLSKSELGLIELPSAEAGGVIWAGLDPSKAPDFTQVAGELGADLDALGMRNMHLYDRATFSVKANWKLIMDSMLDSYHVVRLHKDSLAKFFVDTENVIDQIGPHIRVAAARGNFTRAAITDRFADVRQVMVFSYIPFPNGIIVVSPEFISLGVVRPVATDRSEVDYYMLSDAPPQDERMESKLRRSFDLMRKAFGEEDYWASEQCDAGLRSGVLKEVVLGGMEVQIRLFQDAVSACLDRHDIARR